jgi:uncharacterized OsmC-like protein
MSTQTSKRTNGVDVDRLFGTIDAIKKTSAIAKFKFRIRNEWLGCGHNRSEIRDFYGAGQDINHAAKFVLDADEPEILLGQDKGANPVEYLLHALAACVTTAMVYHAAAKGIEIEEVESHIDGDIDLQGFLGLRQDVRRGFEAIRMRFKVKADVTDEQLEELVKLGPSYSPVFDSITNGVPVAVTAERK